VEVEVVVCARMCTMAGDVLALGWRGCRSPLSREITAAADSPPDPAAPADHKIRPHSALMGKIMTGSGRRRRPGGRARWQPQGQELRGTDWGKRNQFLSLLYREY
jgi:hypothetical protein